MTDHETEDQGEPEPAEPVPYCFGCQAQHEFDAFDMNGGICPDCGEALAWLASCEG